jgi:hypothetical protein
VLDVADIDALTAEVIAGTNNVSLDVTNDGLVNQDDRTEWISNLRGTFLGDSNLDGEFGSADLVAVFTANTYEDGIVGNSTWGTGDWNGDAEFDTSDLVAAFVEGAYEKGPKAFRAVVPEPSFGVLSLVCFTLLAFRSRASGNSP